MKSLLLSGIILLAAFNVLSKEMEERTFLILFNKGELKKIETSTAYIEFNFFEKFRTKSYAGNSEAAILITVPQDGMTECEIGETLVQINQGSWMPLNEIAFRIIDLDKSRNSYQSLLAEKNTRSRNHTVRLKL